MSPVRISVCFCSAQRQLTAIPCNHTDDSALYETKAGKLSRIPHSAVHHPILDTPLALLCRFIEHHTLIRKSPWWCVLTQPHSALLLQTKLMCHPYKICRWFSHPSSYSPCTTKYQPLSACPENTEPLSAKWRSLGMLNTFPSHFLLIFLWRKGTLTIIYSLKKN